MVLWSWPIGCLMSQKTVVLAAHRDFSAANGLLLTSKSSGRPPGTTPDCKDRAVPLAAVRRSIESRVHSKGLIALEFHEQRARTCDNTRRPEVLISMQGETRERWQRLCEQAAIEQNPARLMDLVNEINRLLDEKQERLNNLLPIQKAHPKLLDLADRTMAETSQ